MTRTEIRRMYFEWVCGLIKVRQRYSYRKLLKLLSNIDFIFSIPMDVNRAEDGEYLRYRFACDTSTDQRIVTEYLDDRPCSVLEMMAALSLKCEENIMSDPEKGDRTGFWFWNMIESIGLEDMYDSAFHEDRARRIINRFLLRKYEKNGKGGLFTVNGTHTDMRKIEIWRQMYCYVNDILREEKTV